MLWCNMQSAMERELTDTRAARECRRGTAWARGSRVFGGIKNAGLIPAEACTIKRLRRDPRSISSYDAALLMQLSVSKAEARVVIEDHHLTLRGRCETQSASEQHGFEVPGAR